MKKFVLLIFAVAAVAAFAGVEEPFKQFSQADYTDYAKPGQGWWGSDMFTLSVKGGSDVWLSNYVRSWFEPIPDLHGNVYDMGGDQKYGYIFKSDLTSDTLPNGSYSDKIHWSNGDTNKITYFDDANPELTNTATGYFLDYFKDDAEIYLVMTTIPEDGVDTVDTYQFVQDANNETLMQSRQHNTNDLANNVRVNFGIDNGIYGDGIGIAREFVAVYDDTAYLHHAGGAAGGPLPSLLFVGLLSMGTVFGASRMKKRS
ncbi:MAG: hypothetical protein J5746_09080 [Victivallales bacterium]|nr:hypothetical protein [Victivallales bacterium]